MVNREKCHECGSSIVGDKCSCGYWLEVAEQPPFLQCLEKAILAYNELCEKSQCEHPLSGDHHTGTCILLFKGNHDTCETLKGILKLIGDR